MIDHLVTRNYIATMRVVGIRQLKARLSEYLREVRRGERFLVTNRDEVVAELGPPGRDAPESVDDVERALAALVTAGEVTPPRLAKADWTWRPKGSGLKEGAAAALLDEARSDREP